MLQREPNPKDMCMGSCLSTDHTNAMRGARACKISAGEVHNGRLMQVPQGVVRAHKTSVHGAALLKQCRCNKGAVAEENKARKAVAEASEVSNCICIT